MGFHSCKVVFFLGFLVFLSVLLIPDASANEVTVTVYTNQAEWAAALTSQGLELYHDAFNDNSLPGNLSNFGPWYLNGAWLDEFKYSGHTWWFSPAVYAFGGDWTILPIGGVLPVPTFNPEVKITYWDPDYDEWQEYTTSQDIPLGSSFFGVISNRPIRWFKLVDVSHHAHTFIDAILSDIYWGSGVPPGEPPVVMCKNYEWQQGILINFCYDNVCETVYPQAEWFDNGSYDPDGTSLTYEISPSDPIELECGVQGVVPITLTVTDEGGASSSCNSDFYYYCEGEHAGVPAHPDLVEPGFLRLIDGPCADAYNSSPVRHQLPDIYEESFPNLQFDNITPNFEDISGTAIVRGWNGMDLSSSHSGKGGFNQSASLPTGFPLDVKKGSQTQPTGVGDFSQAWTGLNDIDPMNQNWSPLIAFIDDGVVVPGTGGSLGTTWTYGPSGFVVNSEGGLAGPSAHIQNEFRSLPFEAEAYGYDGALLSFDAYIHEPLAPNSPGIFCYWKIRSTDSQEPFDIESEAFKHNGLFFYGGPGWYHFEENISTLLVPGCRWVQIAFGVREMGWMWGWTGTDATPAPYFDNILLQRFEHLGPAIHARETSLAQDNFPEIGAIDFGDLSANSIRFDMASNVGAAPGDSITIVISAIQPGSEIQGSPKLFYKLKPNSLFDPFRSSGLANEGYLDPIAIDTVPTPEKVAWDLPDDNFFFPGDKIHYFVRVEDNFGGVSLLPADTTGFSNFSTSAAYPRGFSVSGLPTLHSATPGDQPKILLWNDFGGRGNENEWFTSLANLGFIEGVDFDYYYTNSPSSGVGNGLGGRAFANQLSGYETIIYTCGDLRVFNLGSGGFYGPDTSRDLAVLDEWLQQGDKNMLLTGDNLVTSLHDTGVPGQAFISDWLSVDYQEDDVRDLIDNQSSPRVQTTPGNSVFFSGDEWIAYGGPPHAMTFDAVIPVGGAERLAAFTNPAGETGAYPYAAATLYNEPSSNSNIISLPFAFMNIHTDPESEIHPQGLATRTNILSDILLYFGHLPTGSPSGVPSADVLFVSTYPNPFNPSTKIAYHLPQKEMLSINIYNIRGELVRALLNEVVPAGNGSVHWDGRDGDNRTMASGVYFCQVKTGKERVVEKITLVK